MSENNGEHTANSNEQSEQAKQAEDARSEQSGTAQPAQPTQPARAPEGFAQHGYGAPVPPAAQHYASQTSSMNTPPAGAPAPPAARLGGYGTPAAPSPTLMAPRKQAPSTARRSLPPIPIPPSGFRPHRPTAQEQVMQGQVVQEPTAQDRIAPALRTSADRTRPSPSPQDSVPTTAVPITLLPAASGTPVMTPAPAPRAMVRIRGTGLPGVERVPPDTGTGRGTAAQVQGRQKVGMGMFTTGVLAAALVGGLVGGGSLFLLNQQSDSSSVGGTSQSAPLVVNNTNSVNQVTAAAAKAMPSVVTISATSGSSGGTGSGIILDTEGHILTNTHVVTLDGAAAHAAIQVQTSDNKVYDATIVGTDPLSDLAVIKIDAPNLVPATLGESNKINVGDTVIAIGSPLGLNATVTEGIVSTLNRTIQVASSAVPETPATAHRTRTTAATGSSSPLQAAGRTPQPLPER
ncbi:trypsin-like peptidase domain-containing protein [Arthrobacter alpinus]|nr:trypsin-like peptidase domain-containing protein [Arthrobacter alpinus]